VSVTYVRNTVFLFIGAILVAGFTTWLIFQPLVGIIQNLTSGTKVAMRNTGWLSITTAVIAACMSLTAVVLAARECKRAQSNRWVWVIALIIGFLILIYATGLAIAAPQMWKLFKDLGAGT
jgi:hypothetical protein